jgi:8-oxo-dGTP pyrophosphatase MutT (NUDIX family)
MPKPSDSIRCQCGAVPFMVDRSGRVRVALLTSRETQRWVIPKGWPMAKRSAAEAARREVREEAGLSGTIIDVKPVGHYVYKKRLAPNQAVTCKVAVFLLRVRRELGVWPERAQRVRAWFSPEVAATFVAEKGLAAILRGLTPNALNPSAKYPKGKRPKSMTSVISLESNTRNGIVCVDLTRRDHANLPNSAAALLPFCDLSGGGTDSAASQARTDWTHHRPVPGEQEL